MGTQFFTAEGKPVVTINHAKYIIKVTILTNPLVMLFIQVASYVFTLISDNLKKKVEKIARRNFRIEFEESEIVTEEKLRKLCSRSVSVHGLYEIFESGKSYDELNQNLKSGNDENRREYYSL